MASSDSGTWKEIESSERYLVSSMFEEALMSSASVLRRIRDGHLSEDAQLNEIKESAGMVLVQSLKALGRTSEILEELKLLFGAVPSIPVEVLITGTCFQISENCLFGLREFLDEFLSNWKLVDEEYYVLSHPEANMVYTGCCDRGYGLELDEYLDVVEIYAVKLLGMVLNDVTLAISWVESAALPEDKRQELLRRLHSLYTLKATNSSQGSSTPLPAGEFESASREPHISEFPGAGEGKNLLKGDYGTSQTNIRLFGRQDLCFWWFRHINLKVGRSRLIISNGKIMLGCLVFLLYLVLRRKRADLMRTTKTTVLSLKKALVDFWKLAFSYQVNPLAAVQSLPVARR
ncbi:hypothetical protein RJ641_026585 [Dillenia turbinata]|uniref:Uncharacterized protein n=1 Tax=Dillenia turbinata TaxID=194707 RepID=A0AAN8ZNV0_9MAGN